MRTVEELIKVMKEKGYHVFEDNDYNINLVGVRTQVDGEQVSNLFNDTMYVFYKQNNKQKIWEYPCTTIPGKYYFQKPMMPNFGTAILVPGQYRGAYALGYHFGKPALQQVGNLKLFRDNDLDEQLDLNQDTLQEGNWFGINIHYSYSNKEVHNWSAGCQVLNYEHNHPKYVEFLNHFRLSIKQGYYNSFTYTLLESADFS